MPQSAQTLLTHTKSKHIVTTNGENLTTGEKTTKPIRGSGIYTIPSHINYFAQQNPNVIKLIKTLGLCLEI